MESLKITNILDPVQAHLPGIWDDPNSNSPALKPRFTHFIKRTIYAAFERNGYDNAEDWCRLYLSGSLTTYQYGPDSDVDVNIFVNSDRLPDWSRAEMVGIMVSEVDGTKLPSTTYPLQVFVMPHDVKPADKYRSHIRSGYDIDNNHWIEPPDRKRVMDIEKEENAWYVQGLEAADKMESLLKYEPTKAVQYLHQIHQRRQRDSEKGDFGPANITYKFLERRGLLDRVHQLMHTSTIMSTSAIDHQGVLDYNAGTDLQGLPGPVNVPGYGALQFHGNADLQRLANEYNQANGLGPHPQDYAKVNPELASQVANAYDQVEHNPHDPQVRAAYDALIKETQAQYEHLTKNGYQFEFYPQGQDPYPNSPREAVLDLHHNKHMYVYPTAEGYGMDENPTDHPMLQHTSYQWNGQPVHANDLFRAVHDVYGHAKEGLAFRADGEDNAYRQHASMFSPQAQQALASETRGQNSWVNYGPNGQQNQTASQADTLYAPQKAAILPQWASNPDLHSTMPQAFSSTVTDMPWGQTWDDWQAVKPDYTGVQGHKIGYDPATHSEGKGFILKNGDVWTWPTNEMRPKHMDMAAQARAIGVQPGSAFHIRTVTPDRGEIWQHGDGRNLSKDDQTAIRNADYRLDPWTWYNKGNVVPVQTDSYGHADKLL